MNRPTRYLCALLLAAGVTGGVATQNRSVVLLGGLFGSYALATAIALRYPALVWRRERPGGLASAVVGGGATAGGFALAAGVGPGIDLGAGLLGVGLVIFGVSAGLWLVERTDSDDVSASEASRGS